MRIWDLPVGCLCGNHLLAEHRELHAIWSIILLGRKGYSRHPEVLRWHGRLGALSRRHEEQVREMSRRGYVHRSPLNLSQVPSCHMGMSQHDLLEPVSEQERKLRLKGCACKVSTARVRARPTAHPTAQGESFSGDGLLPQPR